MVSIYQRTISSVESDQFNKFDEIVSRPSKSSIMLNHCGKETANIKSTNLEKYFDENIFNGQFFQSLTKIMEGHATTGSSHGNNISNDILQIIFAYSHSIDIRAKYSKLKLYNQLIDNVINKWKIHQLSRSKLAFIIHSHFIVSFILQCASLVILIIEYINWLENDSSKSMTGWHKFQSFIAMLFSFHPCIKLCLNGIPLFIFYKLGVIDYEQHRISKVLIFLSMFCFFECLIVLTIFPFFGGFIAFFVVEFLCVFGVVLLLACCISCFNCDISNGIFGTFDLIANTYKKLDFKLSWKLNCRTGCLCFIVLAVGIGLTTVLNGYMSNWIFSTICLYRGHEWDDCVWYGVSGQYCQNKFVDSFWLFDNNAKSNYDSKYFVLVVSWWV